MIDHDLKVVFIHVPKTAGKSILNLWKLPEFQWQYNGEYKHLEHIYGHVPLETHLDAINAGYKSFAVIRSPFHRFVSAYSYLMNGGCNNHDAQFRDNELLKFKNINEFCKSIYNYLDWIHFIPQCNFVVHNGSIKVNKLINFNHLNTELLELMKASIVPNSILKQINSSHQLIKNDILKDLNEESKIILNEVYEEDIKLFASINK